MAANSIGSLPVTLSSVKTAFGGPSTLLSYNRGGSYVPGIANAYPNVATSVPISLAGFANTWFPPVQLPASPLTISDSTSTNGSTAGFYLYNNGMSGKLQINVGGYSNTGLWIPSANADWRHDYEVYALKTAGANNGSGLSQTGTLNTWTSLASSPSWTVSAAAASIQREISLTMTFTIRSKATSANLVSTIVILEAQNLGIE